MSVKGTPKQLQDRTSRGGVHCFHLPVKKRWFGTFNGMLRHWFGPLEGRKKLPNIVVLDSCLSLPFFGYLFLSLFSRLGLAFYKWLWDHGGTREKLDKRSTNNFASPLYNTMTIWLWDNRLSETSNDQTFLSPLIRSSYYQTKYSVIILADNSLVFWSWLPDQRSTGLDRQSDVYFSDHTSTFIEM